MPNGQKDIAVLLEEAVAIESPVERDAFVERVCGDDADLRRRLAQLIRNHFQAGDFLERPVDPILTEDDPNQSERMESKLIGRYKLLEQIGEGGFGIVYMAEQQEPVRRKVALKLLKPGMDTRQVIARFEAERQALALMDHPHIAKVFDAGTTDNGRPYFVMELVKGIPVTHFCDQSQLSVRERLELFVTICRATQHAHQKGIIHRDLKPSNILVTLHDDKPVVKIIDFGIAKATSGQLTEKTLYTGFAQMVGTPLYMSPEQAALSGLDVDTRTDVYSLGVLLYELLTGTTPFDRQRLQKAAFDEVLRIIREEEPKKPSTRISTLGETLSRLCLQRKTEPRKLSQLLRGDLDWIVMKALEKDRTRRYDTANGFARDVERYLANEVVEACPPSAGYRLRKLMLRNKVALTTVSLVAAALVAGIIVSTWQAIRVGKAEDLAQSRLAESEENLRQARGAVDEYFTLVSQSKLFDVPSLQPLRKDLLEAAVRYYETLVRERGDDPALLADLAVARLRVAEIYHEADRNDDGIATLAAALDVVERLRRDHPDARDQHRRMAGFWKAKRARSDFTALPQDPVKAESTLRKFIEIWESLAAEYPEVDAFGNDLAAVYAILANWQGSAAGPTGSRQLARAAIDSSQKAIAIWERLGRAHPEIPEYREGRVMALRALRLGLSQSGRRQELPAVVDRLFELSEGLAADYPKVLQYRMYLAESLHDRGQQLESAGRFRDAADAFARQLQISRELADEVPNVCDYPVMVGEAVSSFLRVAPKAGRSDEAKQVRQLSGQVLADMKRLSRTLGSAESRDRLAAGLMDLGSAVNDQGEPDSAEEAYRQCVQLARQLVTEFPRETTYQWRLGHALRLVAFNVRRRPEREREAEIAFREAEGVWIRLTEEHPQNPDYAQFLADTRVYLADALINLHRHADADLVLRRALAAGEKIATDSPQWHKCRKELGHALWRAADVCLELHRPAEAEQHQRRAVAVFQQLAVDFPLEPYYRQEQSYSLWLVGRLLNKLGRPQDAEVPYRDAAAVCEKLTKEFPNIEDYRVRWSRSFFELAETLVSEGKHAELAAAGVQFPRIYPDTPEEYQRSLGYLERCVALARMDAALSPGERKSAIAAYAKRAAGLGVEVCQRGAANPMLANNVAWWLATSAEPDLRVPATAVTLVKKALEASPSSGTFWNTLGAAQFRAGDGSAAEAAFRRSMELRAGGDSSDWFFLAMLNWRRGDKEQARKWFDVSRAWTAKFAPKSEENLRFRAEAAAMLGLPDDGPTEAPDELAIANALVDADPNRWTSFLYRARVHENASRWEPATSDLVRAIELGGTAYNPWYERALVALAMKDAARYRSACEDMLKRFGNADDPETAQFVAWTCSLSPGAVADLHPAVALAAKAAQSNPKSAQYETTRGAVLYRSGRFEEAVQALEQADHLLESAKDAATSPLYTWFFLAMAHQRAGHREESKKWLNKACEEMNNALKAHEAGTAKLLWNRRLTLEILRREAESVATST
jgi:eukaryotic-like serine/threonine-protein kinase